MIREYRTIHEISGPLMVVDGVDGVGYDELAEIRMESGGRRLCRVLEVDGSRAVVQLFESAAGIRLNQAGVRFLGHPLQLGVSKDCWGACFPAWARQSTAVRRCCARTIWTSTGGP